ncbi:uncharacterized protein [Ptychodera flava]|uniref:uncharacterized protein n=1 Tax=Ptychodera flava TaxID=63121 RepID=UPI00396A000E
MRQALEKMKAALSTIVFLLTVLAVKGEPHSIKSVVFSNRCGRSNTEYGLVVTSHPQAGSYDFYNRTLFCEYTFNAMSPYGQVMLEFTHFDISVRYADHADCSSAYMRVYDGASTASSQLEELCGSDRPALIVSTGSSMTLEVLLDGNDTVMDFRAIFTSFREDNALGVCPDTVTDFHCETTKRCISTEVTCITPTNISNCGNQDYSDQSKLEPLYCPEEPTDLLPLWIALGILGAILLYLIYWCCWRPGYAEWACGCWRHKTCCDPCKWCSQGSRNCCRAFCAGPRGCHCCGPRNVGDSSGKGYNKMASSGPSSRKGVYVANYTGSGGGGGGGRANGGTSSASTPVPRSAGSGGQNSSNYDTDGLHTREGR